MINQISLYSFLNELSIFNFKDIIEISTIAFTLYKIIHWCKQDNAQLVEIFYGYTVLLIGANQLELEILSKLLFISSPIIAVLFIINHQKTIQQHFISLKRRYTPTKYNWTAALMQASLKAMNKNQNLLCVVERGHSLDAFLTSPTLIDGHITEYFLEALINSPNYNNSLILWCNQKGNIVSFNSQWIDHEQDAWVDYEIQEEHKWKHEALFYTNKTDCLIFKLNSNRRNFDAVFGGNIAENITAAQLAFLLERSCTINPKNHAKVLSIKDFNEIPFKESFKKQQLQ